MQIDIDIKIHVDIPPAERPEFNAVLETLVSALETLGTAVPLQEEK